MTHAELFTGAPEKPTPNPRPELAEHSRQARRESDTPAPNAILPHETQATFDPSGCADMETATLYEEHAQILSLRLTEIEDSLRLAEIYLSASHAIEEILAGSRRLLEEGRHLSEPDSRPALGHMFTEIKRQIDDIVAEAGFDGRNLAAGDDLTLGFDENNSHFYKVESAALSCAALGLTQDCMFESNADLIAGSMEAERAINVVRTRRTVIEMALSVLSSRIKFVREKIQSLRSTSQFLLRQDKAYGAICSIAARRLGNEPAMQNRHSRKECDGGDGRGGGAAARPARNADTAAKPGGSGTLRPSGGQSLNHLTKDLARLLLKDTYLTNWFRYEAGDCEIFTRHFAQEYGPDLIDACKQKYAGDDDFKRAAEKYMRSFEARIEDQADGQPDRKATIDELLKSNQGTVYVVLAKASNRL